MNQTVQLRRTVADYAIAILIFWLTTTPFVVALENGFVDWDDEMTLVTNARYRGLGWSQLQWMFSTFHMGHYQPLSWLTFSLDYLFWGLEPFGFHLTSIVLHGFTAVLVYFVTFRLFAITLPSAVTDNKLTTLALCAFVALLFGVHPLRVESVAWVTQRRDVLSAFLLLSTVLFYLIAVGKSMGSAAYKRCMAGAIVAFTASLLSKAAGITFPIVLVVLDVYPLGRLNLSLRAGLDRIQRRILWEKAPFFVLAVVFGIVALFAQHHATALRTIDRYGIGVRIAQGFYGIAFYLWKTVAPTHLAPLYELPVHFNVFDWPYVVSGLLVLGISFLLFYLRGRWPAGLASWVVYVAILLPVLGTAQSGPQLVADRYSYLSCLPWSLLAGWALSRLWQSEQFTRRRGLIAASLGFGFLLIIGLAVLTWNQVRVWHDSEKLWRHAVAMSPDSPTAHYNLGVVYGDRGAIDAAQRQYERSLEINPAAADVLNNLANLALRQKDLTRAVDFFERVLKIDPADADVHYNLGAIYAKQGNQAGSAAHFQAAARLKPGDPDVQVRLAELALDRRDLKGATTHLQEALKTGADVSQLRFRLGTLLALSGQLNEAADHLEKALQTKPDFAEAHLNLGKVKAAQGDMKKATEHFSEAVRLHPDFAEAHESLAMALAELGRKEEAVKHHQAALRLQNAQTKSASAR